MTNSQVNPKTPPRFSAAVARGLREAGAISLGVVALMILVALLSFDPRDPGFSSTGLGDITHNRVGSTGAYLADHVPGVPVRVIGFRPHGVRAAARGIPAPTESERTAYGAWVAASVGADLVTVV